MSQRNFVPRHRRVAARAFNGRAHIDKMYDTVQWLTYRKKFLGVNHECYACGKPAEVVDHLIPHQGDQKLFERTDNHLPLCIVCHNTVTGLFDAKYRAGNPITKKIEWLNKKRAPRENWTPKKVKVLPTYP